MNFSRLKNFYRFGYKNWDEVLTVVLGFQMVFCFYTVAFSSIAGGLLIVLFIFGGVKDRIKIIAREKWVYLVVGILLWAPITLLWSSNKIAGYDELKNLWFYLLLLVGSTIIWDERKVKIIIGMFIFGAMSNFIIALIQWAGVWPLGGYDPVQGPVGYSYRVFLGVDTVPLIIFMIWDMKNRFLFKNRLYPLTFVLALLFQLGVTTGRTGQALLFILLVPFVFIIFSERKKILSITLIAMGLTFVLMVLFIPSITLRWHDALTDVSSFFSNKPDTDVGLRMVFWDSAIHIIYAHPLFGIGPGSFVGYTKNLMFNGVIPRISVADWDQIEPHNSFLAYATSYGLVGFLLLVSLLRFLLLRAWHLRENALGFFQLVIICSFIVGSFSDVMIFRFAVIAPVMVAMSLRFRINYKLVCT